MPGLWKALFSPTWSLEFILYDRGGEIATGRIEDQEATMLSLHLLQNCMICVNMLMIQRVLGEPICAERIGSDERRGMPPLAWRDVNPKGTLRLGTTARLPLDLSILGADTRQVLFQGV